MTMRIKNVILQFIVAIFFLWSADLSAAVSTDSVFLYTPYTNISVSPGQTVTYDVDAINNSKQIQHFSLGVKGLRSGWTSALLSGGWKVTGISVLPGERKNFTLTVNVPLKINKGSYRFYIVARGLYSLPLVTQIAKQGIYKTVLTTDQSNMEGTSKTTFTFQSNLQNMTADSLLYALQARVNSGWKVVFKSNYKEVSAVSVGPNKSQNIGIEITPPDQIQAGTYSIPIVAQASNTSTSMNLSVVVTGSYNMGLTTPTGLLSSKITAGSSKKIEILVQNTGSSILQNVQLSGNVPSNWDISFEPTTIDAIQPGASVSVFAHIKADKKAIPGDYESEIKANNSQTSSSLTLRMSVETSLLWGWIGILIIFAAIGVVYFLFRKYGRR